MYCGYYSFSNMSKQFGPTIMASILFKKHRAKLIWSTKVQDLCKGSFIKQT